MIVNGEVIFAMCDFSNKKGQKKACYLSGASIFIVEKNKVHQFEASQINDVSIKHKILLFPVVVGGIITPFSLHSLLYMNVNPWVPLITMVLGLLLIYKGWEGSPTISVATIIKEFDFFMTSQPSEDLKYFINFSKVYLSGGAGKLLYFAIDRAVWDEAQINGVLQLHTSLHLYNYLEMNREIKEPNNIILSVNPIEIDFEINLKKNKKTNKLYLCTEGSIPTSLIKEVSD